MPSKYSNAFENWYKRIFFLLREVGRWEGGEVVIEDFEKGAFNNRIWYNRYILVLNFLTIT